MKIQHKTTILAQAISLSITCAMLCQPSFAMQALEDEHLENITGEGIAFVLNDFNLQFNGADEATGTGYTHLIPVGSLSNMITAHNAATANANGTEAQKSRAVYDIQIGKGDIYFYGLSISGNDGDVNTQFSGNTVNVGSADNPWLIQVKTIQVPNFAGTSSDLAYLGIEAPEFTNLVDVASGDDDPNLYDLKIGTWADAFVRDPSRGEGDDEQFWLNGEKRPLSPTDATEVDRENRLRLQAIINGVSLNGTSVKIFQTLDGASTAAGLGSDYSHYNNTLGLALTARINSGDASTTESKASVTSNRLYTVARSEGTPTNIYSTTYIQRPGSNPVDDSRKYQLRMTPVSYATSSAASFTPPDDFESHVMRISTRECDGTTNGCQDGDTYQGLLTSPALSSDTAAKFAPNEGIYLYKPNINLVLGSQWQPLVLGVADDGKNLVLELTRIPNIEAVYKEIYTDYYAEGVGYKGGTCSIYWCGDNTKNATHSSITIGSTNPYGTGGQGRLSAYTGSDAVGVSFGQLNSESVSSGTDLGKYYQLEARIRARQGNNQWRYAEGIAASHTSYSNGQPNIAANDALAYVTTWDNGNSSCDQSTSSNSNTCFQWDSPRVDGTNKSPYPWFKINSIAVSSIASDYRPDQAHAAYTVGSSLCPSGSNCSGNNTRNEKSRQFAVSGWGGAAWWTAQGYSNPLGSSTPYLYDVGTARFTSTDPAPNAPASTIRSLAENNFGSAVIDGLLIQHLKITTKGL